MKRMKVQPKYRLVVVFAALVFATFGGSVGNLHACCIPPQEVIKSFSSLEADTRTFDLRPGIYRFEEEVWNTSDTTERSLTWIDYHMEIEGACFLPWTATSTATRQ